MAHISALTFLALSCLACWGRTGVPPDHLTELKQHAEKAHPKDQALAYAKVARDSAMEARSHLATQEASQAQTLISDALSYAQRASDSALEHHHKMKETEIELRKCEKTLDEMAHLVSAEDAPTLKQAAKDVDHLRAKILASMFKD